MRLAKIHPDILENEGSWDPVVLCGPMARLLRGAHADSLQEWGGDVVDGTRSPEQPVVGAAELGLCELRLSGASLMPAQSRSRYSLRSGDVLVAKTLPVRAAWISPSVQHLRFDATCYAIRNLSTSQGVWLAFCLNQFEYSFGLARRSVASAMPRINSAELRRFPIPEMPVGFEMLAAGVAECIESRALNSMELLRLQTEVAEQVWEFVPKAAIEIANDSLQLTSWWQRFRGDVLDDSLIPGHVKAGQFQQTLRSLGGWRSVQTLVSIARGSGERLRKDVSEYLCLRLSDVGLDLRVPSTLSRGQEGNRNVYAEPLAEDEVLHSLLATNPRTVFVSERPDSDIYPTDHWVRLMFTETPGAWALVMQTDPIARQLRSMTTGVTQQFATTAAVEQLALPPLQMATRMAWDGRVRRWQRQRKELNAQWSDLVGRVCRLLKDTEGKYGPWVHHYRGDQQS